MPPAEYVRLHAEHAANLLRAGMTLGPRDTVTPVVSLAWTRLRFIDPDAALLAASCACLARYPIPVGWLTTAAALPAALAARLTDDSARPRLLDALTRTGLARLDDAGLTMHRFVQEAIRRAIPKAQPEARACATTIITANAPPDPGSPAAWPAWARLYPHLPVLSPRRQDTGPALDDTVLTAVWYLISSGNASEAETRAARLHQSWEYPTPSAPTTRTPSAPVPPWPPPTAHWAGTTRPATTVRGPSPGAAVSTATTTLAPSRPPATSPTPSPKWGITRRPGSWTPTP